MSFVIFLASVYAFLETAVVGYTEFHDNNNKVTGVILYFLAIFCLIVPNLVV